MPRVVHFEINCDNPEKTIAFYTEVFGWKVEKWSGPMEYWMVMTGDPKTPGIDGGLQRRSSGTERTVNTIDVSSLDETVQRVTRHGGKVTAPKRAVPGVGWMAYCTDAEGTVFGLMQSDPNAKYAARGAPAPRVGPPKLNPWGASWRAGAPGPA